MIYGMILCNAVLAGFNLIDTASVCYNEDAVHKTIEKGGENYEG
jgi:diketogulonate reductase-like aldo/keto reductase